MRVAYTTRRLSRVLRAPLHLPHPDRFLLYNVENFHDLQNSSQWRNQRSFSTQIFNLSGVTCRIQSPLIPNAQYLGHHHKCSTMAKDSYFSEASTLSGGPTEAVRELYEKMLKSIEAKTMPPNAWLWSLIESCTNQEDITLLFQILQNLRKFRLSNLRIHANFDCQLCLRVAEACASLGALDFGKKALLEHNVYGLTPSVGSAHYLLLYAKEHSDPKLMVEIMKLMRRNHLPLQPGTADIVFRVFKKVPQGWSETA